MAKSPNKHTFQFSDDISINFEHHGSGGRSLILLHGFGASLESWRDILPFLVKNLEVYLLDLKGFGLSSKPLDGNYSIEHQAEIVASFIEAMRFNDVTLVGHSYGGAVALATYSVLSNKERERTIHALILIDAAGYLQKLPFFVRIPRLPVLNRLVLRSTPSSWQMRFTLLRLFRDHMKVTRERVNRYARPFVLPGSRDALIASAQQILPSEPMRIIGCIPNITVPALIIWGENDTVIPLDHAHRFHREIVGSKLAIIPQCGHMPHEERPVETSKLIQDFLGAKT